MPDGSTPLRVPHSPNGIAHHGASLQDLTNALTALAFNLRWSWNPAVRDLFRELAPDAWAHSNNPIDVLRTIEADPARLHRFSPAVEQAKRDLDQYLAGPPRVADPPRVAYCCAEFAIAECLPI